MNLEAAEWRAIALGWGAGFVALMVVGELNWIVPTAATLSAIAAVILWRTAGD